jgi:hypothetical protein
LPWIRPDLTSKTSGDAVEDHTEAALDQQGEETAMGFSAYKHGGRGRDDGRHGGRTNTKTHTKTRTRTGH